MAKRTQRIHPGFLAAVAALPVSLCAAADLTVPAGGLAVTEKSTYSAAVISGPLTVSAKVTVSGLTEVKNGLDLSGLIVTAHYSNNTNTPVTDYEAEVDLSKAGEKEVIITYQGKTTSFKVTVLAALPFKDVKKTDWFYAGTLFCYRLGLMQGTSETAFSPNTQMTRAQIVTILYSRAGKPSIKGLANPFNDIKKTDWYYNATLWAADQGYVSGMGAGKFAPSGKLTRAQLVTILFAYAKKNGIANEKRDNLKSFKDKAEVPSWALEATQWAVANGVISGMMKNGKLCVSPNTTATRAQVATIMKGFLDQ